MTGQYEKIAGRHEGTWAWSSQGGVDMHYPELWGFVHFCEMTAGSGSVAAVMPPEEEAKRVLREIYYRKGEFRRETGAYTVTSIHWASSTGFCATSCGPPGSRSGTMGSKPGWRK